MDEETEVDVPEVGSVWNYGGDNYIVTRVDEANFIVQCGDDGEWVDAIEITDKVAENESAKVTYVLSLDDFVGNYTEGEITEGASPDNTLPSEGEGEAQPKG